ncbi:MAG: hypothetical protein Q7V20_21740 [Aquabacterium sp.]|uniref:hypothetical protein n=1 Tax=Aquabacterium sp. TaxID=1872578 RepID=UPI00271FFBF8|nr:hypothetical protein [Aquabacterium sp.]MDO9006075.1 hypothetical protein [Aquabacterium sp.]
MVEVHMSEVVDEQCMFDESLLLDIESSRGRQFSCTVSIGTAKLIGIGDLWQGGKRVARPSYEDVIFGDLDVSNARLIKAGAKLDNTGNFLLPVKEHPGHMRDTKSNCVLVEIDSDRRIVIPCMELIRFYFGSSSGLLGKLFSQDIREKPLYTNVRHEGRYLCFDLVDGVPGSSASDIGRIASSWYAENAAALIRRSCLVDSAVHAPIYPKTEFPFKGKTNLRATGRWLSHGDAARQTFVVYQLWSCSHPFGFQAVKYKLSGSESKSGWKKPLRDPQPVVAARGGASKSAKNPVLRDVDPSTGLSPQTYRHRMSRDFPDLKNKSVWLQRSTVHTDSQQGGASKSMPIDDVAVGGTRSSRRVRQVSVEDESGTCILSVSDLIAAVEDAASDLPDAEIEAFARSADDDDWELLNGAEQQVAVQEAPGIAATCMVAFRLAHGQQRWLLYLLKLRCWRPQLHLLDSQFDPSGQTDTSELLKVMEPELRAWLLETLIDKCFIQEKSIAARMGRFRSNSVGA